MGELGGITDPYIKSFLETLQQKLDEAYNRGDPVIILELDHLNNPRLRLAVQLFLDSYVKKRRDRSAYLRSMN